MNRIYAILAFIFTISGCTASFAQETPRFTVIELYTDWCGICAIQDKKLKQDEFLLNQLENKFNFIRFNAESPEIFEFNQKVYNPSENGLHEFALAFLDESIHRAFPVWIILNPDLEIIFQYEGLISSAQINSILKEIL